MVEFPNRDDGRNDLRWANPDERIGVDAGALGVHPLPEMSPRDEGVEVALALVGLSRVTFAHEPIDKLLEGLYIQRDRRVGEVQSWSLYRQN